MKNKAEVSSMKKILCAVLTASLIFSVLPVHTYALSDWFNQKAGNSGQTQPGGTQQTAPGGTQQTTSGGAMQTASGLSLSERKITSPGYNNAVVGKTVLPEGWTVQVIDLMIGSESITCPNAVYLTATSPDGKAKMVYLSERQFLQSYANLMGYEARSSDDIFDYSNMMHTLNYRNAAACCDLVAEILFETKVTFLKERLLSQEDEAILLDARAKNDAAIRKDIADASQLYNMDLNLRATDLTFACRTYQAGSKEITVQAYSSGFELYHDMSMLNYSSYTQEIYWSMPSVYALWTDADVHEDYMTAFQAFALGTSVSEEYEIFRHLNSQRLILAYLQAQNGGSNTFSGLDDWEKENAGDTIDNGDTYEVMDAWSDYIRDETDYTTTDGSHVKLPNAYDHVYELDTGDIFATNTTFEPGGSIELDPTQIGH